jgi:hypothetical protein
MNITFYLENVEEEGHLGDLGADGKVITKYVLMIIVFV